jgi:hypothetical protein
MYHLHEVFAQKESALDEVWTGTDPLVRKWVIFRVDWSRDRCCATSIPFSMKCGMPRSKPTTMTSGNAAVAKLGDVARAELF